MPKAKSEANNSRGGRSPRRQLVLGMILGSVITLVVINHLAGWPDPELQSVLETYYFGTGFAELTGDTSILENVVTEDVLQMHKDICDRGWCDGTDPPRVIGSFRIVRSTEEFAVVTQSYRPIITDLERKPERYRTMCFSLIRDADDWRISGVYINCDEYLPDKYK